MNSEVSTGIPGEPPDHKCSTVNVPKDERSRLWPPDTSDLVYLNDVHSASPSTYAYLEHDPNMSSAACYSPLNTGTDADSQHEYSEENAAARTLKIAAPSYEMTRKYLQSAKQSIVVMEKPSSNSIEPEAETIAVDMQRPIFKDGVTSSNVIPSTKYTIVQAEPALQYLVDNETQVVNTSYPLTNIMNQHRNINYYGQYIDTATGQTLDVMTATSPTSSLTTQSQGQAEEVQETELINNNGQLHIMLGNECYQIEGISTQGEATITYALSQEDGYIIARPTTSTVNQNGVVPTLLLESDSVMADATLLSSLRHGPVAPLGSLTGQTEEIYEEEWAGNEDKNMQDYRVYVEEDNEYTSTDETLQQNVAEHQQLRASRSGRTIQEPDRDGAFTIIPDVRVVCRARATLPVAHLCVTSVQAGVFARHCLPPKTRFGPVEGIWKPVEEENLEMLIGKSIKYKEPLYLVRTNGGTIYNIDVSDETQANWICYLRYGSSRANVWLEQIGEGLYVSSREGVRTKAELRLGYSQRYLHAWPQLARAVGNTVGLEPSLEWSCYECPRQFNSSSDLQKHLDSHDKGKKSGSCHKFKKRKKNGVYKCDLCDKVFPRRFSLSRHLLTHGKDVNERSEEHLKSKINQCHLRDVTKKSEDIPVSKEITNEPADPAQQDSVDSGISEPVIFQKTSPDCDEILPAYAAFDKITTVESNSDVENKVGADHCGITKRIYNNCIKVKSDGDGTKNVCDATENDCDTEEAEMRNTDIPEAQKESQVSASQKEISKVLEKVVKEKEGIGSRAVCVICSETLARKGQVRQHAEQHRSASGIFLCAHCTKSFAEYRFLRKHVRSCHMVRRFPCPQCGAAFTFRNKLQLHMLSHSESRQFLCDDCGKQFKRKDKLKEHIKLQHSALPKPQVKTVTVEPSAAPSCSSRSRDYSGFTFVCRECDVGFKRRGMLVNHIARRHPTSDVRDVPELGLPILRATTHYYCTYCDKVYRSNAKRKQHILNNHPGEVMPSGGNVGGVAGECMAVWAQPCPAPGCYKQYATKAKLLQHQRRKHPHYKTPSLSKNQKLAKQTSTTAPVVDLSATNYVISRNTEPHVLVTEEQLCQSTRHERTSQVNTVLPFVQQEIRHNLTTPASVSIQNEINTSTYPLQLMEKHPSSTAIDLLDDDLLVKQSYVDEAVRCLNYMKRTSNADFAERQQSWRGSSIRESILTQNPQLDLSEMTWLNLNTGKFDRDDQFQKFQVSGHIASLDKYELPPVNDSSGRAPNSNSLAGQYTDR